MSWLTYQSEFKEGLIIALGGADISPLREAVSAVSTRAFPAATALSDLVHLTTEDDLAGIEHDKRWLALGWINPFEIYLRQMTVVTSYTTQKERVIHIYKLE